MQGEIGWNGTISWDEPGSGMGDGRCRRQKSNPAAVEEETDWAGVESAGQAKQPSLGS